MDKKKQGEESGQLINMPVVRREHITVREKEKRRMGQKCQAGHVSIALSALLAVDCIHFFPRSSPRCFPPPFLSLLGCPPCFRSMYIFRSRVIKSAPEGMCWNRIPLVLPCPHYHTNTSMIIGAHAHTNASVSVFLHL